MSWTDYKFDFLRTVSKQLIEELNSLKKTELTDANLDLLSEFQKEKKLKEGVYILYLDDSPVNPPDVIFHRWGIEGGSKGLSKDIVGFVNGLS